MQTPTLIQDVASHTQHYYLTIPYGSLTGLFVAQEMTGPSVTGDAAAGGDEAAEEGFEAERRS